MGWRLAGTFWGETALKRNNFSECQIKNPGESVLSRSHGCGLQTHRQLQFLLCRPLLPAFLLLGLLPGHSCPQGHSEVGVCIVTTDARTFHPEKGAVWG